MPTYVLDTNILIGYIRGAAYATYVDRHYAPAKNPNIATVSIASVGEIYSLALRRKWGEPKRQILSELLQSIPATPIRHQSIIQKYAEIDAYNHGKHPEHRLPSSARSMSNNDIWIAATASVLNATLLTTDRDFDHLNDIFLQVVYVDPASA
ncbi:MAG: type II toxin-antitoxin system VapC family toxin [Nitrospirae bacterium]|nr:type II toxin-antitoxin system VapC family toxin [Nitrospirota bacterium]